MLAGCAGLPSNLEAPTVTISDIAVANATLFEQQFNLKLRIQNPNPEDLRIDGMAFDLEISDPSFAKGVGNRLVTVPRFGSGVISVEAVSSPGGIIAQFSALARAKNVGLKYRIRGRLSVGDGEISPVRAARRV